MAASEDWKNHRALWLESTIFKIIRIYCENGAHLYFFQKLSEKITQYWSRIIHLLLPFTNCIYVFYIYFEIHMRRKCRNHCVKSVQILSFFWSVFSCIWTENLDQKKLRIWTFFTQWTILVKTFNNQLFTGWFIT